MNPFSNAETQGRNIMTYVRQMEGTVRRLRAEQRGFKAKSFALGFVAGAALLCGLAWLLK